MKKLLSIVLSAVMLISVGALSLNAFAATAIVGSQEDVPGQINIIPEVNGKTSKDVEYDRDEDNDRVITFTYKGKGKFIRWDFPGMVEGRDYEILSGGSDSSNPITIKVYPSYTGEVIANAIVEEEESTTASSQTTKQNKDKVSPETGAVAATGIAAMGAGVAILAAAKKKNDAE